MSEQIDAIFVLLNRGMAASAHNIGATGQLCGKCGGRFRDVDSILPDTEGLNGSQLYHEFCHPLGRHENPAKEFRKRTNP